MRAASSSPAFSRSSGGMYSVAEPLVDLLLALGREDLAALDLGDPVLRDREAAPLGVLPQREVVLLRAGEVLQQVAVALGRDDAQVEAKAIVRDDRRLRRALGHHLGDPGQLREVLRQRLRVAGGGDDVEVAHGLLAAARAAGLADPVGGRVLAQHLDHGEQRGQRLAEQRPRRAGRLLLAGGRLEDALLGLRAQAGQRSQALGARGVLQLGERRHAELLPDLAHRLRAEAGDIEELDHLGRDRLAPLRERLDLAGVDDLDDLVLDRGADPRQLLGRSRRARAGRPACPSRARARRRGGRRAPGTRPRLRSPAGRPAARAARPHPRCGGASSPRQRS